MFDFVKTNGESSSRDREDGDDATGSDRPLKKARFAWQVKGKYHLKNETDESNKKISSTEPSTSKPSPPTTGQSSTSSNKVEKYLPEQDFNEFEPVINSDVTFLTSMNNLQPKLQHYPRYVSTYERTYTNGVLSNCNNRQTMSMPNSAENQCIAEWQTNQIGKSCLDNTVNEILELWTNNPSQTEDTFTRHVGLDFAEFINHLPGDNSVENEGILMAISAHGLQNTPSSSSDDASYTDNCSITGVRGCPSCLTPVISDDDDEGTNNKYNVTKNNQSSTIQNCHTQIEDTNFSTPFEYFSEPSQSPYHIFDDCDQNSINGFGDTDSNLDFINTAVSHAIKSKGLTAFCTEYG